MVGTFEANENIIVSDSAEADGVLENSGNVNVTAAAPGQVITRSFSVDYLFYY